MYDPMLLKTKPCAVYRTGAGDQYALHSIPQGAARLESDKGLFDPITQRKDRA